MFYKSICRRAFLPLVILSALFLTNCSKSEGGADVPPDPVLIDTRLSSFNFLPEDNSGISAKYSAYANGHTLYVTLPEGVDLSALKPSITAASDQAKIYVNNAEYKKGVTTVNGNNVITVSIKDVNGARNNVYSVLVKNGIESIDKEVYAFMKKYKIPGISISTSKKEKPAYCSGYGFADSTAKVRVTTKHLFRLASMSKCQTALCIMQLVQEGKLKLDQKVFGEGGIFEQEFGTKMPDKAKQVTVKNFLEHNSGWTNTGCGGDPIFSQYSGKSMDWRINEVVNNKAQSYQPGATYSYFNLGFGILGRIVEKISGKEFEEYIKSEIYPKCNVKDMHVGKDRAGRRSNEVIYYSQSGTNGYNNDMQLIKALGGLIASTDELMELMAHIDCQPTVPDIFTDEILEAMYKPSANYKNYALGWRVNHNTLTDWRAYHTGNLSGTTTVWVRGKSTTCGAFLCNSRNYDDNYDTEFLVMAANILNSVNSKY